MTTRRYILLVAAIGAVALVAVEAAQAKGPSSGTLSGPGLEQAIALTGGGHPGSAGTLGRTAQHAGFYAAVYGARLDGPRTLTKRRPSGALGPRYLLVFRVPGPNGAVGTLRQAVYPYARGGAVTFTRPGQRPPGAVDGKARSGWYRGGARLKAVLVEAGLPATAPLR
jgi:hypothetical protein